MLQARIASSFTYETRRSDSSKVWASPTIPSMSPFAGNAQLAAITTSRGYLNAVHGISIRNSATTTTPTAIENINKFSHADDSGHNQSRRALLLHLAAVGTGAGVSTFLVGLPVANPAAALPLGPLGPVKRVGGNKRTGMTAEEVAEVLRRDLAEGQYFVTGDLTREIFSDDCRFVDPTNDVTGLSKYLTALGVLFDPQYSKVELLGIRAVGPRTVEADWRLGGYLVFPWNPRVEPFAGHTVYTLNDEGLVSEQRQTWSISAATALVESFTPTWEPRRQLF